MTRKIKIGMGILALVFLFPRLGWNSDFHSARTAALAGAGHAAPMLNDAVYLNPSYASFLPTYSISGNYLTFNGDPRPGEAQYHGRNFNASIQDGRSELFQAGLAYTLREDGAMVHVGASHSIIKELGVGLGGKFFLNNRRGYPSGRDATLSVSGTATEWLQSSLIVDNLFETSAAKGHGLRREIILGTKINIQKILLIYFDPHYIPNLPTKFGHETGVEFPVFQDFFLRMGMNKNAQIPFETGYGRSFGLGAGWLGPRISFDYGFERVSEPRVATAHVFGATIYF